MDVKTVCVYCASSINVDQKFYDAARQLGYLLAKNALICVCGAGSRGLMKELADAVLKEDGEVIGVIPRFMYNEGWANKDLKELIITNSIHDRKQKMADLAEAVIAMPGGCGTMEELLEIITWKQLGLFWGPIVILNTDNYYNELISMLEKAMDTSFMEREKKPLWTVATTPEEAIQQILYTEDYSMKSWQMAVF